MKRKLMALLMAMALCVSMLAGCGAGETDVTTEAPETKEQNNRLSES